VEAREGEDLRLAVPLLDPAAKLSLGLSRDPAKLRLGLARDSAAELRFGLARDLVAEQARCRLREDCASSSCLAPTPADGGAATDAGEVGDSKISMESDPRPWSLDLVPPAVHVTLTLEPSQVLLPPPSPPRARPTTPVDGGAAADGRREDFSLSS
jgi:hypothetical protein